MPETNVNNLQPIECNQTKYNHQNDDTANFTPEQIIARMTHAWNTIKPFAAILNSEIVQFFNRNHWSLLPLEWRDCLINLSVNQLAVLIDAHEDLATVATAPTDTLPLPSLPKSLLKIRQEIKNLSLSRKHSKYHRLTTIYPDNPGTDGDPIKQQDFRVLYEQETKMLPFYDNLMHFDKKQPPLSLLKYKCKDKKLAEIVVMGDLVFKASLIKHVDFVVDVGSGLGHLSRCLAYFYGLDVVAIEMDAKMTEEAHRLDAKFLKILKSLARKDSSNKFNFIPKSTIVRITCEVKADITPEEFHSLINSKMAALTALKTQTLTFGLVGLHPCGDLAPTMLKLYKNCPNCQFINLASCCYNKMSIAENKDNPTFIGFPLTTNIVDIGLTMGRNQLGLALHALESHQVRFQQDIGSFKADFYRALVEKFIECKHLRRRNVKTGPAGVQNFEEYLKQSLPEIAIDARVQKALEGLEDIDEKVEFHKIVAFSALRHMFAPLVESIVLLDRLLYLKQDSEYCHVTQRFEPGISPRVHVITAFKISKSKHV